ncbi:MAG: universal stress protein [Ardenticatenaceae bacterium]|nr:universal stress protein [Ardenticatenaceae bacterium]MCB9443525.1 universal stress protein [Ardenticatenaceae bacterium]
MKILICIGGLPFAEPTLKFGNLVAALSVSEVTLLTVVDGRIKKKDAAAMLAQARELINVPVNELKVRRGQSVEQIVDEACHEGYDMIVVGSRVMNRFTQLLLRSVTQRVAEKVPISVLVVKEERPSLKRILVCTGGQKLNQTVIERGAQLAKAASADVQLLYVTSPVPVMYSGLDDMDETLPELLQTNTPVAQHLRWAARYLAEQGVSGGIKVRHGIVSEEIVHEAEEGHYDLIVVGARTEMSLLNELLMEKVTPRIVEQAPSSVLVVREK